MTVSRVELFRLLRAGAVASIAFCVTQSHSVFARETLHLEVPAECGSREVFLRDVATLQRTATARLTVSEVVITQRNAQSYELRLVSPEGPRVVVDADCRTLLKTAAVIAATLAQPEAAPDAGGVAIRDESAGASDGTPDSPGATTSAPEPSLAQSSFTSAPPANAPPANAPPANAPPATEPRESRTFAALQLGVGAAAFGGLSPEPHLGLELLAGMTGKRWGGHVLARLLPPRSMLVRDELGLRETVWGGRVSVSRLTTSWLRASLGLSGYWISARGLGVSDPTTDGVGLLAPELEVVASILMQQTFRAEIGVQGRIGLTRPRFEIETGQVVYELPRLGAAAVLRILWTDR